MMGRCGSWMTLLAALLALATPATGQGRSTGVLDGLRWRSLGPAVMGGRFTDVSVHPQDPSTIYVAAASGGVFKTTTRGSRWKPIFDAQSHLSIGDIALAPSRPETLYVGTGEANNQRSSYAGDGVWKSTDGGRSFAHVGLAESHHIGRIAIHPQDPDVVYVAALGHLYTPNPERGLYRTRDGGETWDQVLRIDEDTGVVDVIIDPTNPDQVYAATYQRRRRAWHFEAGGSGSGIHKSEDGGDTWRRLDGGLPGGDIGRIGLDLHVGSGLILFACVENRNERRVVSAEPETEGETDQVPGKAARLVGGEVYRSGDGGDTWSRVNKKSVGGQPAYYYGQIRVDPVDPDELWLLGVSLFHSKDGGVTWKRNGARGVHVDHHCLWINPADTNHMILGNDGGICFSQDRGRTWDVLENLPVGQFYTVCVDDRAPYRIYGGLQDNGTYMIPSRGATSRGISEREVLRISGGDGFYCAVDPEDPDIVYSESQFGRLRRTNLRTWKSHSIRPKREKGEPRHRFNWNTPVVISPHNARTVYTASQQVRRSRDRGHNFLAISPDLTTNDEEKIKGNVPHCSITTLAESPLRAGVIWVGTDDGKVQITQDHGQHWRDVTDHFPGEVRGLWVSRVFASAHERGKAWVSFTGYRENRFEPYLFVTDDYGGNWTPLHSGLPRSSVNVVREDTQNPDLLFAGTDRGVQVSRDGGDTWQSLGEGMPRAPVHDLALQDRVGDLVAATHGRGLYVLNVAHLRELTADAMTSEAHLCRVRVVPPSPAGFFRGSAGAREFVARNPKAGVHVLYHLARRPEAELKLRIADVVGKTIRDLRAPADRGVNRATLSFRRGRYIAPGSYVVELRIGKLVLKRPLTIPKLPSTRSQRPGEDKTVPEQIE